MIFTYFQTFINLLFISKTMPFLTISELIDIIIMTFAVGYIFYDAIKVPRDNYEPLNYIKRFDWNQLFISALIVAPGIIIHELAHKFTAIMFGLSATFNAAYMFLGLGILMKLMNFGFIFFVPAYVSISGMASQIESSLVALTGPLANLIIWGISSILLKTKKISRKYVPALLLTKKINIFLFIFNILPIPGFDGYKVLSGVINIIM